MATFVLVAGHQVRLSLVDSQGPALQQLAGDLGETMLYQQADITQSDAISEQKEIKRSPSVTS